MLGFICTPLDAAAISVTPSSYSFYFINRPYRTVHVRYIYPTRLTRNLHLSISSNIFYRKLLCAALAYFLGNIYIRFGTKLHRLIIGIPMSTNCAPLVADLYWFDRSKAVVPALVLLFVALWFILRGDLLYVFPCVILFLCFSVLLVLRLPRLGKKELILVLFVRLFDLCLFGFVEFVFLLGSGKGCGLWLWHSLDFSLTFLFCYERDFILALADDIQADKLSF